jgi:hypothetical protein
MTSTQAQRRKGTREDDPELKGRRSDPRARVLLSASADAISGHLHVTLLEVSVTGARLSGSRLPSHGKDVMLACAGIEMFGTVVWQDGEQCGIKFDEPLSLRELIALRSASEESQRASMTLEERLAAADWLNGVAR